MISKCDYCGVEDDVNDETAQIMDYFFCTTKCFHDFMSAHPNEFDHFNKTMH